MSLNHWELDLGFLELLFAWQIPLFVECQMEWWRRRLNKNTQQYKLIFCQQANQLVNIMGHYFIMSLFYCFIIKCGRGRKKRYAHWRDFLSKNYILIWCGGGGYRLWWQKMKRRIDVCLVLPKDAYDLYIFSFIVVSFPLWLCTSCDFPQLTYIVFLIAKLTIAFQSQWSSLPTAECKAQPDRD